MKTLMLFVFSVAVIGGLAACQKKNDQNPQVYQQQPFNPYGQQPINNGQNGPNGMFGPAGQMDLKARHLGIKKIGNQDILGIFDRDLHLVSGVSTLNAQALRCGSNEAPELEKPRSQMVSQGTFDLNLKFDANGNLMVGIKALTGSSVTMVPVHYTLNDVDQTIVIDPMFDNMSLQGSPTQAMVSNLQSEARRMDYAERKQLASDFDISPRNNSQIMFANGGQTNQGTGGGFSLNNRVDSNPSPVQPMNSATVVQAPNTGLGILQTAFPNGIVARINVASPMNPTFILSMSIKETLMNTTIFTNGSPDVCNVTQSFTLNNATLK